MTYWLQHGFGKAQKISTVAANGNTTGVILSAADEDTQSLAQTALAIRDLGLQVLVDTQSYLYSSTPQGVARFHEPNGVSFPALHWSQDAAATQAQLGAVELLNRAVNPDGRWIAPSVLQSSFADVWTPLALQFARTASDMWGGDRTVATVVIDEAALASWDAVDSWLDVATTLDVSGFYILVNRSNTGYPPVAWATDRLTNLMRLNYTLSAINDYEVLWGFSDSEGLLSEALGASMAVGWTFGLRQFSVAKWQPSGGGRPAIIRYYMPLLWSSLRAEGEADLLHDSGFANNVFLEHQLEEIESTPFSAITRATAQEQFMIELGRSSASLREVGLLGPRLDALERSLEGALDNFRAISAAGAVLEARYAPRVASIAAAVAEFRSRESL